MDYTAEVKETIQAEQIKAGFNVGGENGADKVVTNVLVAELAKQNDRLEALEQALLAEPKK